MPHNFRARVATDECIRIHLVGCGGNGSHMLYGLARMHIALQALDMPGLHVTAFDFDTISPTNIGRQQFAPGDVGKNKADVLIQHINIYYGLRWESESCAYNEATNPRGAHIVIGCVDTKRSRRIIFQQAARTARYWLDLGNTQTGGQVVLGEPVNGGSLKWIRERKDRPDRLPTVLELFPAMAAKDAVEDTAPSCSMAEALERQDLFINQTVATWALHLLWQAFRHGTLDCCGYFINLNAGRVAPIPLDPEAWARIAGAKASPRRAI